VTDIDRNLTITDEVLLFFKAKISAKTNIAYIARQSAELFGSLVTEQMKTGNAFTIENNPTESKQ